MESQHRTLLSCHEILLSIVSTSLCAHIQRLAGAFRWNVLFYLFPVAASTVNSSAFYCYILSGSIRYRACFPTWTLYRVGSEFMDGKRPLDSLIYFKSPQLLIHEAENLFGERPAWFVKTEFVLSFLRFMRMYWSYN